MKRKREKGHACGSFFERDVDGSTKRFNLNPQAFDLMNLFMFFFSLFSSSNGISGGAVQGVGKGDHTVRFILCVRVEMFFQRRW
jgi:hypothetical protein